MSIEKTEAIVLKTYNWSESSRTVVFFSKRHGKIALVDKGGRRFKSKRGRLMPFARFEITFYASEKESRGYISDIELIKALAFEKDGTLGRLAYGSAACELLSLTLPEEEPQRNLYDYLSRFLETMENADKRSLLGLFLSFFLRLLTQLGYHPSLTYCSGCGAPITEASLTNQSDVSFKADTVRFYPDRGGVLCQACQTAADYYIPLSADGFGHLVELQNASLIEAAAVPIRYSEGTLLLEALTRFLGCQAELKADLKSLEFLDKLKNSSLNG